MVTIIMRKSIRVTTKKRRGRPPTTGRGIQIGERWHEPELAAIDAWIATSGKPMTRAQAVRRLVEIGLKAPRPPAKVNIKPGDKTSAAELAAQAIDGLIDSNASPDELDRRRSRLTRGPLEFRKARVDQPKNK